MFTLEDIFVKIYRNLKIEKVILQTCFETRKITFFSQKKDRIDIGANPLMIWRERESEKDKAYKKVLLWGYIPTLTLLCMSNFTDP